VRIATLSDIHSNVFALEAVIYDAKKRGVELMLNLGDILYGPIAPKATFDLLREHEFVTIRGNQDRQIYEATQEEIDSNPTMQVILDDLGQAPLDWMRSLPFDNRLSADIYICHGTPANDLTYLLENTDDKPVSHSMENYCPHASYAIIEESKTGWKVQHIKVPYDFQQAAEEAKKQKREDWVHFLTTGKGL